MTQIIPSSVGCTEISRLSPGCFALATVCVQGFTVTVSGAVVPRPDARPGAQVAYRDIFTEDRRFAKALIVNHLFARTPQEVNWQPPLSVIAPLQDAVVGASPNVMAFMKQVDDSFCLGHCAAHQARAVSFQCRKYLAHPENVRPAYAGCGNPGPWKAPAPPQRLEVAQRPHPPIRSSNGPIYG